MRPDCSVICDDSARLPSSRRAFTLLLFVLALGAGLALLAREHELASAQSTEADLWVQKSGQSWRWPESTAFEYHVTVRNDGPDAALGTWISDTMPAGMQFVSASSPQLGTIGCSVSEPNVSCSLGNIPNQSGTMDVIDVYLEVVTPPVAGDPTYVTNHVSITSDTPDPDTTDNQDSDELLVQNVVTDLWVDESGPATVFEDTEATYSTLVHNDDDWTAHGVVLTYVIPTGTFVSADLSCTVNDHLVTCPVGDFPALGTATYHLTLHPPFGSTGYTTLVSVASSTEDDDLADNDDSVDTAVVRQQTDLRTTKTGPAPTPAGSEATDTITLQNTGDFAARHIHLFVALPPGSELVSSDGACVQHYGLYQAECEVSDVAAHTASTVHLTYRLPTGQSSLPEVVGTSAWFSMDTPDTDTSNNTGSSTITVLPTPPRAPGRPGGSTSFPAGMFLWWANPTWNGGTPVRTCTVTSAPGGATLTTDDCAGSGGGSTTMTGLTPGVAYTFTVRATNDVGTGPASEASDPILYVGPPPDPPTAVGATAGDGQATVSWTIPANTGGSWPIGFEVVSSPDDRSVSVGYTNTAVVPGLTNGTTYTFRVRATSDFGDGSWSDPSNPVTPIGLPGPPTDVQAIAGNASAQVTWSAPASNGGSPITGYRVRVVGGAEHDVPASPLSYLVTGLTNGTTYTFEVAARSSQGLGPWSTPTGPVTPQSLPGPPTNVQATAGDRLATVSWQPPFDTGGNPILSYTVTASPGGQSATVASSPTTITGLTNGTTYTFSVRATTSVGTGPAGTSPPLTPAGLPGAPTGVTGRPAIEAIQVSWNAVDANGSAIGSLEIERRPGGAITTVAGNPTSATVEALSPLTAYTFRVRAINGAGTGPWSTWSTPIIPAAPPARFLPLPNPVRILDTRDGPVPTGYPVGTKLAGGSYLDLQVNGVAGVPTDASAVVLNVTAVFPTAPSHLTVWPAGQAMPTASNLNFRAGEVVANLVVVKVGAGGRVSIYNNSGAVHVVADVTGYDADDASGSLLAGVQPKRLVDSREGIGTPKGPWTPTSSRAVTVAGADTSVPGDATAVVLNLTAVWPTAATHLAVWPTGQPMPLVSNLNLPGGDIRPNLVIVKVGDGGKVSIYNNSGAVDVVADVVAYFDETVGNALFTGVQPKRLLDSREGIGTPKGPWSPASQRAVTVAGADTTVPADATAVVLNLTAILPSAGTHLAVWPTGQTMPWVSNVNLGPGDVRPNLVVVKVGAGGQISIYNNSGAVDVVADVVGYYGRGPTARSAMAPDTLPTMARGRVAKVLTTRYEDGATHRSPDEVIVEEPLAIHLDDALVTTTMRTPGHDFELAAGFCFTEGLLAGVPVQTCRYCGTGSAVDTEFNVVSVETGGRAPVPTPRLGTTTSSCGLCGSVSLDELADRLDPLVGPLTFGLDVLAAVPDRVTGDQDLFTATGAVHAAAAFTPDGEVVLVREDVGRHNAVDKIVGRLLLDGRLPAAQLGLYVSGRASFEIVQKAWAAGFPAVVAVSAPTSLAVETARRAGITLAGFARAGRLNVYAPGG